MLRLSAEIIEWCLIVFHSVTFVFKGRIGSERLTHRGSLQSIGLSLVAILLADKALLGGFAVLTLFVLMVLLVGLGLLRRSSRLFYAVRRFSRRIRSSKELMNFSTSKNPLNNLS